MRSALVALMACFPALAFGKTLPKTIEVPVYEADTGQTYDDGVSRMILRDTLPKQHELPPAERNLYGGPFFGDQAPYPRGILLVHPPVRERVIVIGLFDDDAFGIRVLPDDDAPIDPLPWIAGGFLGALLFAMTRRRHHPIGDLV